jgi:hypothetical protein
LSGFVRASAGSAFHLSISLLEINPEWQNPAERSTAAFQIPKAFESRGMTADSNQLSL